MRMCCGCNQRFEQRRLIRLQVSSETQALIPVDKKQAGRSAWVCCNSVCIHKIQMHPKKLQRSLRKQPRMDTFLADFYRWMCARVRHMLSTMHGDGAISLVTPSSDNSTCIDLYKIPPELSNYIRLNTIDLNHIQNDKTHALLIHKHHLRQSTILCIDVLVELKLD